MVKARAIKGAWLPKFDFSKALIMLPATVLVALLAASPVFTYSFERSIETTLGGHLFRRDTVDYGNSTLWPSRTYLAHFVTLAIYTLIFVFLLAAANGGKAWTKAFAKAKAVVAQMTVEELFNVRRRSTLSTIRHLNAFRYF